MARIQITIDIPRDGPAQVSITTDDNALPAKESVQRAGSVGARLPSVDALVLKRTRQANGWNQAELAKRIGCSVGNISQIELGHRRLTPRLQAKITKAGIILNGG